MEFTVRQTEKENADSASFLLRFVCRFCIVLSLPLSDTNTKPPNTMTTIASHTPATGNQFFYVETSHGFMCSFTNDFEDVWFVDDLESDTPLEGPEEDVVRELIEEATA